MTNLQVVHIMAAILWAGVAAAGKTPSIEESVDLALTLWDELNGRQDLPGQTPPSGP